MGDKIDKMEEKIEDKIDKMEEKMEDKIDKMEEKMEDKFNKANNDMRWYMAGIALASFIGTVLSGPHDNGFYQLLDKMFPPPH